jgi:hypothetical protein
MPVPEMTEESVGRTSLAAYVANITADLAALARRNGLDTLGYLLEMARLEADTPAPGAARTGARTPHNPALVLAGWPHAQLL